MLSFFNQALKMQLCVHREQTDLADVHEYENNIL